MTGTRERRRILVVDDSAPTLEVLRRNLESAGHEVICAGCVDDALGLLALGPVDLVVTDVKMPKVSGLDLVRHIRENLQATEVMVITGYPNVDGAISALKGGATDYLRKPFTDEELRVAVAAALERLDRRAGALAVGPPEPPPGRFKLIGDSEPMRTMYARMEKAARTDATVLVTGESGTGKELVARGIHYGGPRRAAAFVPVHCGAIPEHLLESELFGHVRGAFTGATEARAGFFLTADGGSVFLDEVGETSLSMQVKLLRVLQDGEVRMVGSSRTRRVRVRVIAATNRPLPALVDKRAFREDLYFRLNVIPIQVPPLRDRGDDVLLLAKSFARRFADELAQSPPTFSDRAARALREYAWPGNVRELENLVRRAVVMGTPGAVIDVSDLPEPMRFRIPSAAPDLRRSLADMERDHIVAVLQSVGGNKTRAATILGIDRKTLRAKLE